MASTSFILNLQPRSFYEGLRKKPANQLGCMLTPAQGIRQGKSKKVKGKKALPVWLLPFAFYLFPFALHYFLLP